MKIIWESGWAETHYDRFEHSGWVHSEHREARILIGQNGEGFHMGLEEKHQGEFHAQRWGVPRKSMEETKENGRQYLNEWLKENGMKPLQDGLIEPWKSEEEQE